MSAEVRISGDIYLECSKHRVSLAGGFNVDSKVLSIDPCSECLDEAKKEGEDEAAAAYEKEDETPSPEAA